MLNNSLYQAVMRSFNQKQAEEKYRQDQRIRQVYAQIPEYQQLDESIVTLCADTARQRILHPELNDDTLHSKIESLRSKQQQLLHDAGFPEDYMELHPDCPLCKDTGFYQGDLCTCFRQAATELLYKETGISAILQRENFDAFRFDLYSDVPDPRFGISPLDNIKAIVNKCHQYIDHFDTSFSNMFIYGETGVGKSFLTHCIAAELLDRSHSVLFLTAFELIKAFEQHTFGDTDSYDDALFEDTLFNSIMECDVLIIDDLGTETVNNFTVSQLFLCLNHRQQNRKSTIISTNLPVEALQDIYSERIFSRIVSYYEIMLIIGDDIRFKLRCSE